MGSISSKFIYNFNRQSFLFALVFTALPLFLQWPLFWDNLPYVGGIADYFFEHGISASVFHLPKDWDVAHSPVFAALLAIGWKLFGKSLLVAYWVQLPFVFITLFCAFELVEAITTNRWSKWAFGILLLSDTQFFTQLNQLGYEWILLAPFMMSLLRLIRNYKSGTNEGGVWNRYGIWIWLLAFTQLRGVNMVVMLVGISFALMTFETGFRRALQQFFKKDIWLILGTGLITFLWLLVHKLMCGYWTNASSNAWSGEHLVPSSFFGFGYKILLSIWRLFDYGFVSYLALIPLLSVWAYMAKKELNRIRNGILVFLIAFGLLALQFSVFDIPVCHRYFLVLHILLPIGFVWLLAQVDFAKVLALTVVCSCGVASGYFWEYPARMANGREVQASSICYFPLRDSVEKYMQAKNISNNEVVSHFPICVPNDWVKLTNTNQGALCGDIDTAKSPRYIIYSNFSNGFTDAEKEKLSKMDTVRFWRNGPIHLMLLRCP